MKNKCLFLLLMSNILYGTKLYIENWSIYPIDITELVVPEGPATKNIKTNINVQAGQSLAVRTNNNGPGYDNFNQMTLTFKIDGNPKTETVFFPNEETEEASLSFSDSGYKRYPFSVLTRKQETNSTVSN